MSSTVGKNIKLSIFGESHGAGIGGVIDGLPPGESLDFDQLLTEMKRRAPGQDKFSTPRKEKDIPEILSGILDGRTTGAPLGFIIKNTNTRSQDYKNLLEIPRPSHSDYTGSVRYQGFSDIRGGGHFSGRLTAPLVFAGAVAKQILNSRGVYIGGHMRSVGNVEDDFFDPCDISPELLSNLNADRLPVLRKDVRVLMESEIESARINADSVGGVCEAAVIGMPAGIGSPMFEGVENVLAAIIFGVPAVKGVEFGAGFDITKMRGSSANDPFILEEGKIKTKTNHSGGIQGGITNGMPIIVRAAFKPTSSIGYPQQTLNIQTMKEETLVVHGRHDPCVAVRGLVALEAALAIGILDLLMRGISNI